MSSQSQVGRMPRINRKRLGLFLLMILLGDFGHGFRRIIAEEITLEVSETRGLRRRNYPTSILLQLAKAVPRSTPFRLTRDGKPMTAQIRPDSDGPHVSRWWIDFLSALAPNESHACRLEFGPTIKAGPEPARGHYVQQFTDVFTIRNGAAINWTVPRDLTGLIQSVRHPPIDCLRANAPGLTIIDRLGKEHRCAGRNLTSRIVRSGPLAVALQFRGLIDQEGGPVPYNVDMMFPARVSWADIACRIDDSRDRIAAIEAALNIALDAPTIDRPTLVDFGASSLVYAALNPGQTARLESIAAQEKPASNDEAQIGWRVLRGSAERLESIAVGNALDGRVPHAEGWAHIMDRRQCVAMAVDAFGRAGAGDAIDVKADGAVVVRRHFPIQAANRGAPKTLRTWWHFVRFPPQQGAATSAHVMQSPLRIRMRSGPSHLVQDPAAASH
jgi:hypothetical protein